MFCECEIIPLLSVAFCVVTAVRKFDFRLLVNETSNMERSCSEERLVFLTGSIRFPLQSSRVLRYSTHAAKVLGKGLQLRRQASDNRHGVLL